MDSTTQPSTLDVTAREISARLSRSLGENFDAAVEAALRSIAESIGADAVLLTVVSKDGWLRDVPAYWVSSRTPYVPLDSINDVPSLGGLARHLTRETAYVFEAPGELPHLPGEREIARRLGIRAGVVVLLNDLGDEFETISVASLISEKRWPEETISTAETLGHILVEAIHRRKAQEEFERSQNFNRVVAKMSAGFVNLSSERVDAEIEHSLEEVCNCLGLDLGTVLQWSDPARSRLTVTHEWAKSGESHFRGVSLDEFPWLLKSLRERSLIKIDTLDDFPASAEVERATCERIGIRSVIWVPFEAEGNVAGYVALDAIGRERAWSTYLVEQIRLVGQVYASALTRRQADLELRIAYQEIVELKQRLQAENVTLRSEVSRSRGDLDIVGESEALRDVLEQIQLVADTDSTVLLLGETGTGKGLFARVLHAQSTRCDQLLVTVNCAAIPETLLESELFGHEKGAFTGALKQRIGRFEVAAEGTIVLDEIGELPFELQAKLLRALQEREFERVGSTKTMKMTARVIATTNRDLERLVEEGTFRADLFYRLSVFPVHVPPLRERREDIPLLIEHILDKIAPRVGRRIEYVPEQALKAAVEYDWPGNIRELENTVERALILSRGPALELQTVLSTTAVPSEQGTPTPTSVPQNLDHVQREHIVRVLEACNWKVRGKGGASEKLGLKPTTLQSKMKRLDIRRPVAV